MLADFSWFFDKFQLVLFADFSEIWNRIRSRPGKPQPKKGPKRKVHEFRPFLWILVFFLRKTSTIHIEFLFRNAPAKSSWTDLSLVWFAGATPDKKCWNSLTKPGLENLYLKSPLLTLENQYSWIFYWHLCLGVFFFAYVQSFLLTIGVSIRKLLLIVGNCVW